MKLVYSGKNVLVVGLGKTGVGLCRFLAARGARVTATDSAAAAELAPALAALQGLAVNLEVGRPQPARWQDFDLIVASPGVPPELPWLVAAVAQGIPLIGELEIASPLSAAADGSHQWHQWQDDHHHPGG